MQNIKYPDCMDQFIAHCKNSGLKITPQRCAVYSELIQSKNHPTADEMYQLVRKKFPNISYDTVNRTLLTFAEIGLVDVIKTKEGPRHFDAILDNHHHFHCVDCGRIIDFYSEEYDNLGIPNQIQDNFTVFTKRVVLNGLCKQCRKKKKSS
ncbi:MAG: transcriptional repressor [Candidatus Aminicenantes bacterium]|nr:MAG: transcriptional repressor [Candidatus Aminicenantes bacterium]